MMCAYMVCAQTNSTKYTAVMQAGKLTIIGQHSLASDGSVMLTYSCTNQAGTSFDSIAKHSQQQAPEQSFLMVP